MIGSYRFAGSLEIGGKISDGTFTAYQTDQLTFEPLTFTATGFDVSAEEAEIVVTPVSTLLSCQCTGSVEAINWLLSCLSPTNRTSRLA